MTTGTEEIDRETLEDKVAEVRQQLDRVDTKIGDKKTELSTELARLDMDEERCDEIQQEIGELQRKKERLEAQLEHLKGDVSEEVSEQEAKEKLQEVRDVAADRKKRYEEGREKLEQLLPEVEQLLKNFLTGRRHLKQLSAAGQALLLRFDRQKALNEGAGLPDAPPRDPPLQERLLECLRMVKDRGDLSEGRRVKIQQLTTEMDPGEQDAAIANFLEEARGV